MQTCSVMTKPTSTELIQQAYVIVRARAIDYEKASNDTYWTTDTPSSIIRFQVEEVIKGNRYIPNPLLINGYLNEYDDFNDHPSPYDFVRPNGRSGSCFANTYKQNANFLLFLNRDYSPYWSPLSPVNEQLYPPPIVDNWLQWVEREVQSSTDQSITNSATKLRPFFL